MGASTTGSKSKYAVKQQQKQNGSYHGNSPYYENIISFQHLKPLHAYPHLAGNGMNVGEWQNYRREQFNTSL